MNTLNKAFFAGNREQTYDALKGGLLVIAGYTQMQRGNDMAARFEQEANFWYLSGIEYPDWWLLLDGKRRRSWLVAPTVAETHQLFDGSLAHDDAKMISGVDEVIDQKDVDSWLRHAARSHQLVYTVGSPQHSEHFGFTLNPAPRELHDKLSRIFTKVEDFRLDLAKIRAIKQPQEIAAMQTAIDLTVKSFNNVYKKMASYHYEYEVEADFTADFRRAGAEGHAYDPIVAGGANACTLHYTHNNSRLKKGQLLLLDIGARHNGYAADITRTYTFGKPTKRQQQVHAAVVDAQRAIIKLIAPEITVEQYHQQVDVIMKQALIDLGLIKSNDDPAYHTYFPHAISHGLGIDVHDSLGRSSMLKSGMVLTVEPGIYIPEEGIGVRIEDDILVTDTGYKNLSAKLPVTL